LSNCRHYPWVVLGCALANCSPNLQHLGLDSLNWPPASAPVRNSGDCGCCLHYNSTFTTGTNNTDVQARAAQTRHTQAHKGSPTELCPNILGEGRSSNNPIPSRIPACAALRRLPHLPHLTILATTLLSKHLLHILLPSLHLQRHFP
jgi:hypothetical protein